MVTNII